MSSLRRKHERTPSLCRVAKPRLETSNLTNPANPMMLSAQDISSIADAVAARLAHLLRPPAPTYTALPHKLTMKEFAWCVQRGVQSVRERRRLDRNFRSHCQGKKRILIHPAALALYGVDSGMAAERLAKYPDEKAA